MAGDLSALDGAQCNPGIEQTNRDSRITPLSIRDGVRAAQAPLRRRALAVVAAGLGNAGKRHFARMAILADGEVA
jgi:hypothetical protein